MQLIDLSWLIVLNWREEMRSIDDEELWVGWALVNIDFILLALYPYKHNPRSTFKNIIKLFLIAVRKYEK